MTAAAKVRTAGRRVWRLPLSPGTCKVTVPRGSKVVHVGDGGSLEVSDRMVHVFAERD